MRAAKRSQNARERALIQVYTRLLTLAAQREQRARQERQQADERDTKDGRQA